MIITAAAMWVCMNGICVDHQNVECYSNSCLFDVVADNNKDTMPVKVYAKCDKHWFMLSSETDKIRIFGEGSIIAAVCKAKGE